MSWPNCLTYLCKRRHNYFLEWEQEKQNRMSEEMNYSNSCVGLLNYCVCTINVIAFEQA
jgi:hypothetical protein